MKTILLVALALSLGACRRDDADTTQTTNATVTPVDQSTDQADIDIIASIRKTVVADRDLSMNARNVKIISQRRYVTLRGMVESDAEKAKVEDEAARVAGAQNVDDELEVRK